MDTDDFLEEVRSAAARATIDLDTPPCECWMPVRSNLQDREFETAGRYFTMALRHLGPRDVRVALACMEHDAPGCAEWLRNKIQTEDRELFVHGAVSQQSVLDEGNDNTQRGTRGNPKISSWAEAYVAYVNGFVDARRRLEAYQAKQ